MRTETNVIALRALRSLLDGELAPLAALHAQELVNVSAMVPAHLRVLGKLDPVEIKSLARMPGDALAQLHPLTPANAKTAVAENAAAEASVITTGRF